MRLIDADKLVARLNDLYEWCRDERRSGIEQAMCIVHEQLTVDAEPVRHGKWIEVVVAETDTSRLINWECSECAIVVDHNTDNYCPNCGARMDGE